MIFHEFGKGLHGLRYAFIPDGVLLRTRLASLRGDMVTAHFISILVSGDLSGCTQDEQHALVQFAKELCTLGVDNAIWDPVLRDIIEDINNEA